ncbi:MAG: DUF2779 domain-containing protein [Gammaproteobacteria bacterium]|nr:DUF2779 domain-containing protein [Gammaproteobacteria bacterium]
MRNQHGNLSKTRLMSARQCLKRLFLEVHRPELAVVPPQTLAAFATGNEVGEIARKIYGGAHSVLIPYAGGLSHAVRKTERLLKDAVRLPIFEATLSFGGVLVRLDALLPDEASDSWRIVEVKSSTSLKEEHLFDCAVQSWAFLGLGYRQSRISLAHVDNQFVYQGNEDYFGLLNEVDVTDAVAALVPLVPEWVRSARDAVRGDEPQIAVGAQCNTPYDCPFIGHCWPDGPYAVQTLPRASKAKAGRWIAGGIRDLRLLPAGELNEKQRRVQAICCNGVAELLPGAARFVAGLAYPRYYLDFETVSPGVPRWAGTRPYEVLPVQWSCHYESAAGQLRHAEFLDLSGVPPMRRVAESLIRVLGKEGPILTYSGFERRVIDGLRERFPDLAVSLAAVLPRLVDLLPVVEQNYYHPAMAGSWSLKNVVPCIASDLKYEDLSGIQEGTAASEGYLEAIASTTSEPRREQLREQLLAYCRYDTEAMVRLVQFFSAGADPG